MKTQAKSKFRQLPILFSQLMVRAVLDDLKTETRRVITKLYDGAWCYDPDDDPDDIQKLIEACPYGGKGDRLWVRETHWRYGRYVKNGLTKTGAQKWRFKIVKSEHHSGVIFAEPAWKPKKTQVGWHKRPSIFLPHWASRILLEVVEVRVQHIQAIDGNGVYAEGMRGDSPKHWYHADNAREKFENLWNDINGKRGFGWDANPWVWVVKFRVIK